MKKKIFITRKIFSNGIDLLKKQDDFEVEINQNDTVLSREELIRKAKGSEAIICLLTDKIDAQMMDEIGSNLKIVANYAVGFDNLDVEAANKRSIIVTNTPEVMTQAVAEHAIALILACARRIVEGDKFVRDKKYKQWEPELLLGPEIAGKTLGIVGIGRIGMALAEIAYHGFGLKVLYSDLNRNEEAERTLQAELVGLNHLLEESDFVSLHVPLCEQTHHLISTKEFDQMKDTAIIVNTARGAIIDEKALVNALKSKQIFAAGIDVFEDEPKLAEGLIDLDNIVLTPHIASATYEARRSMSNCVAQNVIEVLSGREAKTPVKI
ncbi:MAG: D-glycerate dehydrogenase [Candidatus Berkelbacteria bacterium]|nr:D-glycerate dehydrogenase [Candidatus Berkelbacteria bacterium]